DEVVLGARLVGLARAQGWGGRVVAAHDDAVVLVTDRGGAVGAEADEIALHDVALGAVVQGDAVEVGADDVGADAGVAGAVELDAEASVPQAGDAGDVDADEVAGDDVDVGGVGQRAD